MGRAIVRDPAVFLMDEPLSNLDAKLRVQMRTEVARLQHRLGTTTVYVTHDQTEAMTLGDRVAVMRKGSIQQVDTPKELYDNPANLFVAGFIGSPSMNFLAARVVGDKVELPFATVPAPDLVRHAAMDRVIAGIRPEHFEDAALLSGEERAAGVVFQARVDVVEAMGADLYAYFSVEGSDAPDPSLDALESVETPEVGTNQIVARLSADSSVRRDSEAELWFDPGKTTWFDPGTGQNLAWREHA